MLLELLHTETGDPKGYPRDHPSSLYSQSRDTYYVDHFLYLINEVERDNASLLSAEERDYINHVRALPVPALQLYIRLLNRKGVFFRKDKLAYLSAHDLHAAIDVLQAQGFLKKQTDFTQDCDAILSLFTVGELKDLTKAFGLPSSLRRDDYCAVIKKRADFTQWFGALTRQYPVIVLEVSCWEFLKFLYFGRITPNLSDFVIHELGHINPEPVHKGAGEARFVSYAEARCCFDMHLFYEEFRSIRDDAEPLELWNWFRQQGKDRNRIGSGS